MPQRILVRRDTVANWTSQNPILADGEIVYAKDVNKFKVGNGMSDWMMLEYTDTIAKATEVSLGGVKAIPKTAETVEVSIDDDGKLFVPDIRMATEDLLGGIKAKSRIAEPYEVVVDNSTGKAYVQEPDEVTCVSIWKSFISYPLNAICHWNGSFYKSNTSANLGNNPEGSVGFWENIKSGEGGGEGGVDLTYSIRRFAIPASPLLIAVEDRQDYVEPDPALSVYENYYISSEEPDPSLWVVSENRIITNITV